MSKTTVVTGAAGFIGRNVVAALNRRGERELLLVDRLGSDERWKNLLGLQFEEMLSPDEFLRAMRGEGTAPLPEIEAVVHLGACSSTTERDADFLLRNNYAYTRALCTWCLERGVRFVYASSAATYGDGSRGYDDDDRATSMLEPLNMYGYSKQIFDLWALKQGLFRRETDSIAGLKFFNVFGPYEEHKGEMRSVVSKSFQQIREGRAVQLFRSDRAEYADGEQMRDFVSVRDAVAAVLFLLDKREVGGLFNCGTGIARTWRDLVTAVYAAMGRVPVIEYVPMPEHLAGRYQYFTEAKMEKLRSAGFDTPFATLEDAVRDYVQGFLEPRFA